MKKLEKNSVVIIGRKDVSISDVLQDLLKLPAESMLNYFTSLGLTFPRSIRVNALKEVLTPYVKGERIHVKPISDELEYRLNWFETYSETQYINLLPVFEDGILGFEYKEALWLNILSYMLAKKVSEANFTRLFSLAANLRNTPVLKKLDGKEYNEVLNPLFFDEYNMIDGLTLEIFRPVVYKCSTLEEVREIGKKYDVDVPRRLRKQELVEIIKDELKDRGELTNEIAIKIDSMTVIPLQRFAINNNIKVSIELKKEEIIEYILKNAKQTKETYFKPQTGAYEVYDQEDFLIPVKEKIVKEEPVSKPIPEPVFKPEVAKEPIIEKVTVVFKANNDLGEEEILEILKGEKARKPFTPTKENHRFVGWYLDDFPYDFNLGVNNNITLIAKWEEKVKEVVIEQIKEEPVKVDSKKALITFKYHNDMPDEFIEVTKGETIPRPEDFPLKIDHAFVGWVLGDVMYDFDKKVYQDTTLSAVWRELEKVYVRFDSNNHEQSQVVLVNHGESVSEPKVPIKEGYFFLGWHLDGVLYDFDDKVYHNSTLIAEWVELEKVVVTLIFDNGLEDESMNVIKGEKLVLEEDPIKENHDFEGWYLNDRLFDFENPVDENIVLVAKWEERHPLNRVIKEIRKVAEGLEELKEVTYLVAGKTPDKIDDKIDFNYDQGFEGSGVKFVAKEPVIISPHEIKVSIKEWNKLKKRTEKAQKEVASKRKGRAPIPVVVIKENE